MLLGYGCFIWLVFVIMLNVLVIFVFRYCLWCINFSLLAVELFVYFGVLLFALLFVSFGVLV